MLEEHDGGEPRFVSLCLLTHKEGNSFKEQWHGVVLVAGMLVALDDARAFNDPPEPLRGSRYVWRKVL
jgi:hypothetical protein